MTHVDVDTGRGKQRIELHAGITVIDVDADRRGAVVASLSKLFGAGAVVEGAAPAPVPRPVAPCEGNATLVDAEAAVAQTEVAVADARSALEAAERAYVAAQDALLGTQRAIDRDAHDGVTAAEARLEVAQAAAAAARRALVQAREAREREASDRAAADEAAQRQLEELQREKTALEAERAELVAELGALGARPDAAAVEEALRALRRLREVKPRPSPRAVALADRWAAVRDRLATLPMPPAPPEWLVAPALAALNEAREALARAEQSPGEHVDPAKAEAVERAHREVLEAEQRVMRKASRANRRRLEQTQEVERGALAAVGVSSYGDYLQRIAPDLGDGASAEERVAQARAALSDAEAVWEELHGGQASPEYTAAKQEEAEIRSEALALLADQTVEDADLEARLRADVETVVDTEWAEQQLRDALQAQGAEIGDDLEASATAWLATVPERRRAHEELDQKIGAVESRLRDVDDALATRRSNAFFGNDTAATVDQRPPEERAGGLSPDDPFGELAAALEEAEGAEREASDALVAARARFEASEQARAAAAENERDTDAARAAVDAAKRRLEEAERALAAARAASREAAESAAKVKPEEGAHRGGAGEPAGRAGLGADAWLLARVIAARASRDDAPVAAVAVGAEAVGAPRSLRVLERAARRGPVVVLGGGDAVKAWAKGLGERAAIRGIEAKR